MPQSLLFQLEGTLSQPMAKGSSNSRLARYARTAQRAYNAYRHAAPFINPMVKEAMKQANPFGRKRKSHQMRQDLPGKRQKLKSTSSRSTPKYVTRGYKGKFRPRNKRGLNAGAYLKYGSSKKREIGGTINSQTGDPPIERRVLYIGHSSFNRDEIHQAAARAITRKACKMAKIDFTAWDEFIDIGNDSLFWTIEFFRNLTDAGIVTAPALVVPFSASSRYQDLSASMASIILETVSLTFSNDTPEHVEIKLFRRSQAANDDRPVAVLKCKSLKLSLSVTSKMSLQNRTRASSVVGDEQADNANNIENNPLTGRRYLYSGNSSYLKADDRPRQTNMFAPGTSNGLIEFVPTTPEELAQFWQPPGAHAIKNCKKTSKVTINPGETKASYLSYSRTMMWQTYIRLMKDQLVALARSDVNPKRCDMGSCELLGFEKEIDTRESTEPTMSVGWELTQTYSALVRYRETSSTVQIMQVL